MTGALFARIKNWGTTDTLLASDLNAEFDNILNNLIPTMIDGYSANATQMQVQTSPGGVGTESLATSLSGELARLRYQINAIIGVSGGYWYSTPSASIATLFTALGANTSNNSPKSGRTLATSSQPVYLVPAGSSKTLTLKATATPFIYAVAGVNYTISADVTFTALTVATSGGNTCVINDNLITGQAFTNLLGENGTVITVATMGTNISNLTGTIQAFKMSGTEYILARVESSTQLTAVFRGYFFKSDDTLTARATVNNGDTLTLLKINWIYASTAGTLNAATTNPAYGATAPTSPASGDYWFDTANNIWKVYANSAFGASGSTLIGLAVCDTTNCIGARSADFFKALSDLNTVELAPITASGATSVRSRYTGASLNVYGTILQYGEGFLTWNTTTTMDVGQTIAASTYYYLYVKENGDTVTSNIAPFDRRTDLKGFYHPLNTWRCVGYVFCNAATNFGEVESFFRSDSNTTVTTGPTIGIFTGITTAVANFPLPYNVSPQENLITVSGASGAFTQVLPPPAQFKGRTLTYIRTDNNIGNIVSYQAWGTSVLSTTTTMTPGTNANVLTSLASTTGIVAGQLVTGSGIPPGTTVTAVASTVATLSNSCTLLATLVPVNFANSNGISGKFTVTANVQNEAYKFRSDGNSWFIEEHFIPSVWNYAGTITFGAVTTVPTKGAVVNDQLFWRKVSGNEVELRYLYSHTTAGGAGSGDYLYTTPTGLSIDTAYSPALTTAGNLFTVVGLVGTYVPAQGYIENVAGTAAQTVIAGSVYSATQLRIMSTGTANGFQSSTTANFGGANLASNVVTRIPALGWIG